MSTVPRPVGAGSGSRARNTVRPSSLISAFGNRSRSAATCAVESLKDGLDYTGSINRLRFDMEAAPIYGEVVARAGELLQRAGLDWIQVDEVVYAGGSACLPGLDAALAVHLREDAVTPFTTATVAGGGIGDPTTVLARADEVIE